VCGVLYLGYLAHHSANIKRRMLLALGLDTFVFSPV
jgi:hypothetical protein